MASQNQINLAGCPIIPGCPAATITVDCIAEIYQGSRATIDLTIWGTDGYPLDLNLLSSIQVYLIDEYDYVAAIFADPKLIGSDIDYQLERLQSGTSPNITNKGVVRMNLDANLTSDFATGRLSAQVKIVYEEVTGDNLPTGEENTETIGCIVVANVRRSKILNSYRYTSDE